MSSGLVREVIRALRLAERRGRPVPGAGPDAPGLLRSGSTFVRGLSIGALVGAAIAGSTVWERRQRLRRERDATPVSGQDPGGTGGS